MSHLRWNDCWAFFGPVHAGWVWQSGEGGWFWTPTQNDPRSDDFVRSKRGPFDCSQSARDDMEAEIDRQVRRDITERRIDWLSGLRPDDKIRIETDSPLVGGMKAVGGTVDSVTETGIAVEWRDPSERCVQRTVFERDGSHCRLLWTLHPPARKGA